MIVISSFRPFGESQEWDANQMRAFRSWLMFAERIYLFGEIHPILKSNKVFFVASGDYPRIRDMAELAAKFKMKDMKAGITTTTGYECWQRGSGFREWWIKNNERLRYREAKRCQQSSIIVPATKYTPARAA